MIMLHQEVTEIKSSIIFAFFNLSEKRSDKYCSPLIQKILKIKKKKSSYQLSAETNGQAVGTAKSLRQLYFIRAAFSITWVILVLLFAKESKVVASVLLIIYPAWDVFGTFMDFRANRESIVGGTLNIMLAHDPTRGIPSLATYVAFGAFYYLLAAYRLSKTVNQATVSS